jgi:hypothetical protein
MVGDCHGLTAQLRAIETIYKGYRFRSRLEARLAVFRDYLSARGKHPLSGTYAGSIVAALTSARQARFKLGESP